MRKGIGLRKRRENVGVKYFLLHSKNTERDSYVWNMIGSMLMAFQSVILLMVLTRTVGLVESGIFTIAYANANLFLTVSNYGMRNYQVSDVKNQFSFREYLSSRWITEIVMIAVALGYVLYISTTNDYTWRKSMVIIWMCVYKSVDAVEDVFLGEYQKKGRLDVGAKVMSLRYIFAIVTFCGAVILLKDQLIALILTTCGTVLVETIFIYWTYQEFKEQAGRKWRNVFLLLKVNFPLFVGSFLSFYISNAPKYAIDSQLTDELQACYGFIAMPVFVIGLLNGFIFTPMIYGMSCIWGERKIKKFVSGMLKQSGIVGSITLICIIGAYLLGIPVLSFLYNTDLAMYKRELLILLLGGGFLALSGLLRTFITIIRCQNALLAGYGIVSMIAYFLSDKIVAQYGMIGAAVLYAGLMALLCVFFAGVLIWGIVNKGKR